MFDKKSRIGATLAGSMFVAATAFAQPSQPIVGIATVTTYSADARITAVDPANRSVTLAYPNGATAVRKVSPAVANFAPHTEASVEVHNADRGPLLVISGEQDHTIPWSMANAAYKREERSGAPIEIVEIPGRGHSLTIDSGWREVAETALAFLDRHGIRA